MNERADWVDLSPTKVLTAHECWTLLRQVSVGRLALSIDGRPDIFPLNFAVDHETLVFRSAEGTKTHAAENAPAALEADGYYLNPVNHLKRGTNTVWSVVVKGTTTTIAVTSDLMAVLQLPLHPWEAGRKDRFMRLMPDSISGRSFTPLRPTGPTGPSSGLS